MEIRRVAPDWDHPRDANGDYIPLYGHSYESDCEMWLKELSAWEAGQHPDREKAAIEGIRYYWDWEGPPPDAQVYFPKFERPATAFQVYETVSEGRPISPVLHTQEQLLEWILGQGETREFAEEFVRRGGVMSTYELTSDGLKELKRFYDAYNKPFQATCEDARA